MQWALLAVVLLVSTLSGTMLSSLQILTSATETFAARAALTEASPEDVRMTHRISAGSGDINEVEDLSSQAATDFFGDVPFDSYSRITSDLQSIRREDRGISLSYFSYYDAIDDEILLLEGKMPESQLPSVIEALAPPSLLADLGLKVGDTLEVANVFQSSNITLVSIVGEYRVREPGSDFWRTDRLQGSQHDPQMPVPFTGGRILTDGYGPLLVAHDAFLNIAVDSLVIDHVPDFSLTSVDEAGLIIPRVEPAERTAIRTFGNQVDGVQVFTLVDERVGRIVGALAVTRSSVLVTGLLLLVLAIAALGQTARLMDERRHAEGHLMRARGAAGTQIVKLAFFESIALGVVTAIASPLLAHQMYLLISQQPALASAGMDQDPGIPLGTWIVGAVVGLILTVVLISPLLKRGGSFVDSEQARARPGKRAGFQRSGLDLALVVLAGLAYWQLRSYESPVITGGGVARIDPLLAAGPALALLAGALVSVRLIPAASTLLQGIATRGRRAVMPLAAWEVGRRSARAVSAIMLLTLAISVGTFAMSFLTTWKTSQDDQAEYLHVSEATVTEMDASTLAQDSFLSIADASTDATPLVFESGEISPTLGDTTFAGDQGIDGRAVHIMAANNAGLEMFRVGRVADSGGTAIADALTVPVSAAPAGIELPGVPAGIEFEVTAYKSETALREVFGSVRVMLQDADGLYTSVDMGIIPIEERFVPDADVDYPDDFHNPNTFTLRGYTTDTATLSRLATPLRIVGVQTAWYSTVGRAVSGNLLNAEDALELDMSIDNISLLTRVLDVPVPGIPPVYSAAPLDIASAPAWSRTASGVTGLSTDPQGDIFHIEIETAPNQLRFRPIAVALNALSAEEDVPVVMTATLAKSLGLEVGEQARIELGTAVVLVRLVDVVQSIPGSETRGSALIANLDSLSLGVMKVGAPAPDINRWWVSLGDTSPESFADHVGTNGTVTTQAALATSLRDDPLRVGTQAALWLVTIAAVLLAAVGFAVHAVVTVRAREIEFAQLRAVGLQRGALTRVVASESLLLAVLGTTFGTALGVALGYLVAPLVSVAADGKPPIPSVIVHIPWSTVGLLAAEIAVVLTIVVFFVSLLLRGINPAATLRSGDER